MIVLDTHAWIWWWAAGRTGLSRTARNAIETADQIGIAAISCWEVAFLERRRRIALDRDPLSWIQQALSEERVQLLDLTPVIAVVTASLSWDNPDPADRMIVATAMTHNAAIVSKDERMRRFIPARIIW